MPDAGGGIMLLAISLGVAFLASLVWIASRRAFWTIVALLLLPGALSALSSSPLWAIALLAGAGALIWAVWRPGARDVGTRADMAVLLVIPVLLLLGVAGTCLVSGLPLPSPY